MVRASPIADFWQCGIALLTRDLDGSGALQLSGPARTGVRNVLNRCIRARRWGALHRQAPVRTSTPDDGLHRIRATRTAPRQPCAKRVQIVTARPSQKLARNLLKEA